MTIEINLTKLERGKTTEWRTVKRGGKTFRQRFKVGTKDVEAKTSMTKENLVDMVSAYDKEPGDEITGTLHAGDLYRCKFKDGSQGIHKVMEPLGIEGETLYYKVNKILGFDTCPETVAVDFGKGDGSCQKWIPDAADFSSVTIDDMEPLAKIFVQDIICGNRDRHNENVIKDESGKWHAIDNEMWGSTRAKDDWMDALDQMLDLDYITIYCPMIKWMGKQCDKKVVKNEVFKVFKEHVITTMKKTVEHEDEIKQLYRSYTKTDDKTLKSRAKNVRQGLDYIKDYVEYL